MEQFYNFASGPLFKFCLALMALGIIRTLIIYFYSTYIAWKKSGNGIERPGLTILRSFSWIFTVNNPLKIGIVFSFVSPAFHIGLLVIPFFLNEHASLLGDYTGLQWPTLTRGFADFLTVTTICAGMWFILRRALTRTGRTISTPQDYLLPALIIILFLTGFTAASPLNPLPYRTTMIVHVLCGDVIIALIPFSKLSHCFFIPIMKISSAIVWRFPPRHTAGKPEHASVLQRT